MRRILFTHFVIGLVIGYGCLYPCSAQSNDIRCMSISGKVTGLMLPECSTDPIQIVDFRDEYVKIVDPAILDTTRIDGSYNLSINPGGYSLTSSLEGPWVKVMNDVNSGINNASYTGSVTSPSTSNDINWTTKNATLPEMNVFYHINKIHDYVKNTLEYNGMDWQIKAIVNEESPFNDCSYSQQTKTIRLCGENIAFFSHLIYHEYTHAVTESIYKKTEGLSAEFSAIAEGLSFYFASTVQGKRVFFDNVKLKYPNDMTGEPHHDAGILTASFWNMQNSFIEQYGPEEGRALADDLVHNARFGYPDTFPEYLQEILIVDDDNETLVDGTPNSNLILPAFEQHGIFPIVDLAITYPLPGNYIRGDVDITGIVGGYFSNFPGYELYYFKKGLPQEKQLIYSSETPVLSQGLLARWNTSVLDDGIYGLELRTGNQVNCIDNIIVDNFNSAPLVKTNRITRVIFPNKMLRHIIKEVIDIDEPDGPYGGDLECTALTLPEGATFDPESWLFSWNPQESDAGKVCIASFIMADKEHAISFQIDLLVARLFQVMKSQPEEVYYYTPVIYKDKVVFVARNPSRYFDVYIYDISTQETKIVYDNGISKTQASIYGDIVIWVENNGGIKAYDIATSEITDVSSSGYSPTIYENKIVWEDYRNGAADIYMCDISSGEEMRLDNSVNLSLQPSIYDNRVVWQEIAFANTGWNICLYDINAGSVPKNVIVSNYRLDTPPAIYKDKIVFQGDNQLPDKSFGIYLMELSSGNITQIAINSVQSKIYGNKIVWKDYRNGTQDIYMYDIITRKYAQVTYESANERLPNLYENKIIWVENDKICIAVLPESDTTPPSVTIKINNDVEYTTSRDVTLTLSATDTGSGMETYVHMQISNDNETWFTVKMLYTTLSSPKTYTLPPGDGTKTVYVKFKDVAGNESTASDTIILESSQTPWKSNENGKLYTNVGWVSYTMGYRFTPAKNGKIIKLGGYFNGAKTVYLWDSNKKLIASATVNSANNWSYTPITPVKVVAGKTYTVGVYLPGPSKTGSYRYNISTFPKTYGDIKISSSGFYKGNGCPNTVYTYVMYGQVDIGFEPD